VVLEAARLCLNLRRSRLPPWAQLRGSPIAVAAEPQFATLRLDELSNSIHCDSLSEKIHEFC
jgi:hypothetical protein